MDIDITKLSLDELKELNDRVRTAFENKADGYFYVGHIACYGTRSIEKYANIYTAIEAVENSGGGRDYIIDIYTNNIEANNEEYEEFTIVESLSDIPEYSVD